MVEHRKQLRRAADDHIPCSALMEHIAMHKDINEELRAITKTQQSMLEMLTAWNDAKGFVRMMQIIGTVTKWLVVTGTAIGAIYWWFKK